MRADEDNIAGEEGEQSPLQDLRGKTPGDWERLQQRLAARFGEKMDFDAILFLIGLQELGKPFKKYKKDQKLEIMHIAICTLLEPYGFYEFVGRDPDGWPHWNLKEEIPHLEAKQQNKLIIDAIIDYFKKEELI